MSNRKEAIFALFATASIGAIWGGPVPYYGAKVSIIVGNTISLISVLFTFTPVTRIAGIRPVFLPAIVFEDRDDDLINHLMVLILLLLIFCK